MGRLPALKNTLLQRFANVMGRLKSKRLRIYSRHKKSKTTPYKVTLDATANAKQVVALKKFASLVLVFRILC